MSEEKEELKRVTFITALTGMRLLANDSMSMNIKTGILPKDGEMVKDLFRLNNAVVAIGIVPEKNKNGGLLDIPKIGNYKKSQTVRWELQNLWEREGERGKFEDFYNEHMDNIISFIKSKKKG